MLSFVSCFASATFTAGLEAGAAAVFTFPVDVEKSFLVRRKVAHIVFGHALRVDAMLLRHVPPPVVLPNEGFGAPGLGAVEAAGLEVLDVHVPVQILNCAEPLLAPRLLAAKRPVVIPPVMAVIVSALHTQILRVYSLQLEQ